MCLWNFLGPAREKLSYWNHQPVKDASPSKRAGVKRKLSAMNECFLTLARLRIGLQSIDIAYRFNVPNSCVKNCDNLDTVDVFTIWCTERENVCVLRNRQTAYAILFQET